MCVSCVNTHLSLGRLRSTKNELVFTYDLGKINEEKDDDEEPTTDDEVIASVQNLFIKRELAVLRNMVMFGIVSC